MAIEINAVCKSYRMKNSPPIQILKDIDLRIETGEFLIIQGQSGCGKSTLLHILSGHDTPTSGSVIMDGAVVQEPDPSRILLFQHPTLIPWLTVLENVEFGCVIRKERKNYRERSLFYLERFGLADKRDLYPSELSVGMAHRVCIARGLMADPALLLLDEPFRSLDTKNSLILMDELVAVWQEKRFTVVFVTHNIEEAVLLGSRIVMLGGCPTGIIDSIPVDLPYPRQINDPFLLAYKHRFFDLADIEYRQETPDEDESPA